MYFCNVNIALIGYGKMGKVIENLCIERGHTVIEKYHSNKLFLDCESTSADVAIEFTKPELAVEHILHAIKLDLPIVVGTTGWYEHFDDVVKAAENNDSSLFYATNFSIGVNLFNKLNNELAHLMEHYAQYQAHITEIHHTEKKDAPSGTAITLAEGIIKHNSRYSSWELQETQKISDNVLGISAIREENVPGTHEIVYNSEIDSIKIVHTAHNRNGFALGAIVAAEWMFGKKGIFTMNDLIK